MPKSTDFIGSFAKGLKVLEAFGADSPSLTITQAADRTGLDRATARRCLLTLNSEGYADYDGKNFTLTHRALRLGMGAMAALPLPQLVQPWLDQLSEQIEQSCSVAVLEGTNVTYIARAAQKRVMSIGLMPGSQLPAHCTSIGRVLFSGLSDEDVRNRLATADLSPRTPKSLTDGDAILKSVRLARKQGYAIVDQEVEIGLRSIAVPLLNTKGVTVAALNTGMAAIQRRADDLVKSYLPHLLRVQSGLCSRL